ncbi:MAG: isocitrate/isopropylmalate family dehydrogenase [Burkholderiales bacterium]
MGQGKANPTAMLLSAAMMLDWLGAQHGIRALTDAAICLEGAVDAAYASRMIVPFEFGGSDGTVAITRAVIEALSRSKVPV